MLMTFAYAATTLLLTTHVASSRVWYITPDGTGDAPTIQAGIDSASVGDIVELACGTYYEHSIVLISGITLRGETGPDCAVIDGQGDDVLICENLDNTTTVESVTLTTTNALGAYCTDSSPRFRDCEFTGSLMGAICEGGAPDFRDCAFASNSRGALTDGCSPTFQDCVFVSNHNHDNGGGLCVINSSTNLTGCEFQDNWAFLIGFPGAWVEGGGIYAEGGILTVNGCVFTGNLAIGGTSSAGQGYGGAVSCRAEGHFADCWFVDNGAQGVTGESGAAVYGGDSFDHCVFLSNRHPPVVESTGTLTNCLLARNTGPKLSGSVVVRCTIVESDSFGIWTTGGVSIENSIVAFGHGPAFEGADVSVSCSNIFNNQGGDYVNGAAGQEGINGNLSTWPLFCDPDNDNYWLSADSPCLPPNNSCGVQIGAYGQGCGPVGLESLSWARIKARYR
jgi:hypothetical protein